MSNSGNTTATSYGRFPDLDTGVVATTWTDLTLVSPLAATTAQSFASLLAAHESDYKVTLTQNSTLDIGQKPDLTTSTDVLKTDYAMDTGTPYLEWVLFTYGRYLLASASCGTLPANLEGKWASDASNP